MPAKKPLFHDFAFLGVLLLKKFGELFMIKIIIAGYKGRTGQALVTCAARMPQQIEVVGKIGRGDDISSVIGKADAVIDFSEHKTTSHFAEVCAKHGKALVIGTTGHSEVEKSQILNLKSQIPIVWASNYSTGVNALFYITRKAAEILGPDFDAEIMEMHHRMKKDAPSGTAASLAEIIAQVRDQQISQIARYGRQGITGERPRSEIGIHALRGGDVVGENSVIFAANGERLEMTHRASSRETFANGALRAAVWLVGKPAGLYDMQDVLGLR